MNEQLIETYSQPNNPKRQKLIKADTGVEPTMFLKAGNFKKIELSAEEKAHKLKKLRNKLQTAIELEHSTIPPYLCALYSIKEGTNLIASTIIKSVVVEEMLHMILVANILNAIGGEPAINTKNFIPQYPGYLPGSDHSYLVGLEKLSKESISVFLKIEKPATPILNAADSAEEEPTDPGYQTIGQFYLEIMNDLENLNSITGGEIFSSDPDWQKRQVTSEYYYGGGGNIVPVYNIVDARLAIDEIVGQGEGVDDSIDDSDKKLFDQVTEYAHYFRFNEILQEKMYANDDTPKSGPTGKPIIVDWAEVHNMKANPKIEDYHDQEELVEKAKEFNRYYTQLLNQIHQACNGAPAQLMKGMALMYKLKYLAIELMNIPLSNTDMMAGPTFEYQD